ncbi:MAG: membrane protein insertase YidC [Candidatus Omnitrophica bacterium]|nr:membrane protein insertase YidC [Candidatus Omnitrophota bacterium]
MGIEEISEAKKEDLPQVEMDNYVITYSPTGGYIFSVRSNAFEQDLGFENIGVVPSHKGIEFAAEVQNNKLMFVSADGVKKTYTFEGNQLKIEFSSNEKQVVLFSNALSTNMLDQRYQEFFYSTEEGVQRKAFKKIVPKKSLVSRATGSLQGQEAPLVSNEISFENVKFAGSRGRYFCAALIEGDYDIRWVKGEKGKTIALYANNPGAEITLYLGPQKKELLKPLGLQGVIHYGFFHGIGVVMVKILHLLHLAVRNWGLCVILFSSGLYLLLYPLTSKSTKGMMEMREFQEAHNEEIKKLKNKYKDNPQKLHQETLTFYKKHNFNPMKGCSSSCLPMFFQIPIIWAFWNVVPRALEFKGAKFLWIKDLSLPDRLFHLPFSLPFNLGPWINILPILTAILMYMQMKFTSPAVDSEQAQQQKIMATIFPVMMILFLYNLPAALLLYWFTNSLFTFHTQWKAAKKRTT